VTGPYRVLVVCEQPSSLAGFPDTVATEYARTPADAHVIDNPCGAGTFTLQGEMSESGAVAFGDSSTGDADAWQFKLPASPGTFDLVMLFGDLFGAGVDRVAIRRDVEVTGDIDLGPIRAEQEHAQVLNRVAFTSSDLETSERLSHQMMLRTHNTSVSVGSPFSGSDWEVTLAPDSILVPTDRQAVTLTASKDRRDGPDTYYRSITVDVKPGTPTSVTLPEHLAHVTFDATADRLTATLQLLPDHSELWLTRRSLVHHSYSVGDTVSVALTALYHQLVMSAAFSAAAGTTGAVLDFHDVPGFQPAWQHDPTAPQNRELYLVHRDTRMRAGVAGIVAAAYSVAAR
jgi:hypothetical protein